ncbi:MAG TPA: PIN domain-containing protein [Chloroflexota bacterium]
MHAGMVIRAIGTLALVLVGWQVGSVVGEGGEQPRNTILGIGIGGVVGFTLAPYLLGLPYSSLRRLLHRMPMAELLSAIIGLILGLIVAALLAYPLSFLPWSFGHILPAVAALVFAYLGISLMLARHRELAHFVQARIGPTVQEGTQPGIEFLVDTSAIIDGRIADISQAGFLYGTLVVPRFVLSELQHIADSADSLRRARGRRGLEVLGRLQKESTTPVRISDADPRDVADVDGKLVILARMSSSPVITNDFNLNRIAELQGVRVLNINQLANAMKPVVIPGEEMSVHIIQEGKEFNQGVGYLDDGTMIVVENGRRLLHRETEVVVTRVIQTAAGRMIFAQPKSTLQA